MSRIRTLLISCLVGVVSIGGFLAGRATAQQVVPDEAPTTYTFPQSWGDLKTVVVREGNYAYVFEAVNGTIRTVEINGNNIGRIQVTQRPGIAPQGGPGTLR